MLQTYYTVMITKTAKDLNSSDDFGVFDVQRKAIKNLKEVREFLKETYKHKEVKRVKTYRNNKNNKASHIGYAYSFINQDISHDSEPWEQCDWVEVRKVQETLILPYKKKINENNKV